MPPIETEYLLGILFGCSLVWLLATRLPLYAGFRRRRPAHAPEQPACPISVVVICDNQAAQLRNNLPAIMEQTHPRFEIILVDNHSDDDTHDVICQLEKEYPGLRHTYVPAGTRYIHHTKLAISLGLKAAKYEWVVLTHAACRPRSTRWLSGMSRHFNDDTDVVMGYANYEPRRGFSAAYTSTDRFISQLTACRLTASSKRAYGSDACNLALRKSLFLATGGYGESLRWLCGEDLLLTDRIAGKKRTRTAFHPDEGVSEIRDYRLWSAWKARETARTGAFGLCRHKRRFRKALWWHSGTVAQYAMVGSTIAGSWYYAQCPALLYATCSLTLLYYVAAGTCYRLSRKNMGERPACATWLFYEFTYPLQRLFFRCSWKRHKRDFIRYI